MLYNWLLWKTIKGNIHESTDELKGEIRKAYGKFIVEFDDIPEEMKDLRSEDVDRTPAENLAYNAGWTTLLFKWEQNEQEGRM